ncbi:FmdB family zinc ribbon protein [Myxococcus sp. Y35]|uniref:FmdB family zinc ribbon protein n=1 Tax=Pseudomyxococcus flavus TaxID=3115648 RepID=UPI003CF6ACC6
MPVYEYFCRQCKEPFTEVMSVKEHDEKLPRCPKGHETKEVEKRISTVNAVTTRKSVTY